MAVTFGFYNSIEHDRTYNANDFSRQFDGIINDGVFATIDQGLVVSHASGMTVNVSKGKAWFKHTWTINDSLLPLTLDAADIVLKRIDAVILEVDQSLNKRANSIKIKKGTAATNPSRPTMTHSDTVDQYALAYITVNANVSGITQSNITNVIGTSETPFVTGILQTLDASTLYSQWQTQFEDSMDDNDEMFRAWYQGKQAEIDAWFDTYIDELSEDQAINLQNQINAIGQNLPFMSYGTNDPGSSTPGYGTNGSLYFKVID